MFKQENLQSCFKSPILADRYIGDGLEVGLDTIYIDVLISNRSDDGCTWYYVETDAHGHVVSYTYRDRFDTHKEGIELFDELNAA